MLFAFVVVKFCKYFIVIAMLKLLLVEKYWTIFFTFFIYLDLYTA